VTSDHDHDCVCRAGLESPRHYAEAFGPRAADGLWFEVHPENLMVEGGAAPWRGSETIRANIRFRCTASRSHSRRTRSPIAPTCCGSPSWSAGSSPRLCPSISPGQPGGAPIVPILLPFPRTDEAAGTGLPTTSLAPRMRWGGPIAIEKPGALPAESIAHELG